MYGKEHSISQGRAQAMNLAKGGQNGAMMAPHEFVSSAAYAKQKVIPVVLRVPDAMQYLPNKDDWIRTLVELMTTQMTRIEGLNQTVEREFDTKQIGNAGEELETLIAARRQRSAPSYTWYGRYNDSITRFFMELNRLILRDPDTQCPGILALDSYRAAGSPAFLPNMQGMTMLFIEPNNEMTEPVHAVMLTNMMAKTDGIVEMRYETHYTAEVPETNIEFTNTAMPPSATVWNQARNYLNSLRLENLRPTDSKPFVDGIGANVAAAGAGFKEKIDSVVNSL